MTDFWQQMRVPAVQAKAKETGQPANAIAMEAEIQQGKNIVDAAEATKETLDTLVLSVLSDSRKWSKGKITWNYHFEGKWKIVEYLEKAYPELYKKTSLFQPAFFLTNLESQIAPRKVSNESYVLACPLDGDKKVPMYHPRHDTGSLVKALVKSSPGKNLLGYGSEITFDEIAEIWSKKLGKDVKYQRSTVDDMDKMMPGGVGKELGEMFEYFSDPGYFGGEEAIKELGAITPEDLGVSGLSDVKEFLKGLKL